MSGRPSARYTLVSFHAHPDDETLLTGGTLARAAAEGHRVVLVVATDGEAGLAGGSPEAAALGERRRAELAASAAALGCARVELLGYPDSGSDAVARPGGFAAVPVPEAAERLAAILVRERADALTIYDPQGGYGHRDHVQVHHVGLAAARLAGTPLVLEATADRRLLSAGVRAYRAYQHIRGAVRRLTVRPGGNPAERHPAPGGNPAERDRAGGADPGAETPVFLRPGAYTAHDRLTHRVDVRRHIDAKRAAMRAHATQSTGAADRTLAIMLRLPRPLYRVFLGREWFVEHGAAPARPLRDDIFASLRPGAAGPGARAGA
ncbi:MAG: PIG-L family deacetylase [Frankiaceae bacterium]|jgi:LmbE family N-acetylglucosaminyl deacetylase|nr:PIG-L family deacetylase [Frankiaceae bacterium]